MVAAAPGAAVAGSPSAAAPVSESNVQVLTDATFEQETQAVTGSTSGMLLKLIMSSAAAECASYSTPTRT